MSSNNLLSLVSAVGCGLIGGFFYAFSFCVMRALGQLPAAQGLAAMQSINVVVINPWFMVPFVGLLAPCAWLFVDACRYWEQPGAPYRLAGAVLYVAGTFLVTMLCNVPRNDAMAALSPDSPELASHWAAYLSSWTGWNHVRTACSCAASALFAMSLRSGVAS